MTTHTPGIHHVTAIAADPRGNREFYEETLGLRLIKRSVNQDDVSVYHLFYGDRVGSPGTSMTFFPYEGARPGEVGQGQVTTTAFLVPEGSLSYWESRLAESPATGVERTERRGDDVLAVRDPDGLPLELVARGDAPPVDAPTGSVPEERAIRGFFGTTLTLADGAATADLLTAMGFEEQAADADDGRRRFESDGERGFVVDLVVDGDAPRGRSGAGTVHHVAFRIDAADQADWRELLIDHGLRPTEVIDRKWFESIYVRTPGGVLFEFATEGPGYDVDEPVDSLGERLVLPEWLEDRRAEIESGLPPLSGAAAETDGGVGGD